MLTKLNCSLSELTTDELMELRKDLYVIWAMRIENDEDPTPVAQRYEEVIDLLTKRMLAR